MSPRDDSLRLGDMLAAASDATSFVAGAQNLSIPWSLIVGMRNRLVHNYFEVVGLHGVCLRVSTQASDKLRRDR